MAKVTYTADNGSVTEFVDNDAVQAAVAAAIAAQAVPAAEVIADVKVENTDGSSETLVPDVTNAPVENNTAEVQIDAD